MVNGAMAERARIDEKFVRNFTVQKNYGSLLAIREDEAVKQFKGTRVKDIGVPEKDTTGNYILVVEWAITAVSKWSKSRGFTSSV